MDLTKYKDKGRIGLENLGNTCFLNACMQVLNNTYELNDVLDANMKADLPKKEIPSSGGCKSAKTRGANLIKAKSLVLPKAAVS